jgi:Cu(I)/Ag(I) efflux system membrane fusion protein
MHPSPAKRKLAISLAIGAALAAGLLYAARLQAPAAGQGIDVHALAAAPALESYTCPMHADVLQHHPGTCPICGMTLVKVAPAAHADHAAPLVQIDQATGQRMGVRMAPLQLYRMHRVVDTFATIGADESRVVAQNPKVEGWIRRLNVHGPGQQVRKGQLLYEIYSPELQQRQREYIDLLARRDGLLEGSGGMGQSGPNQAMLGSLAKERYRVRDRLLAADMPPDVLAQLEKDRRVVEVVPVRAAQDGTVQSVSARAGSYVNPMQTVLTYADYSRIWAELTLFPDQLGWIRNGDSVVLTSGIDKRQAITARVELANLQFDPASRSARLRLSLPNVHRAFSPGAYVEAQLRGAARAVLAVPRDALIRTGHGDFVVQGVGHGQFRTVPVTTGLEDHEQVEIVGGLAAGDEVAVNAQFLLDSAASLQAMQQRQAAERRP